MSRRAWLFGLASLLGGCSFLLDGSYLMGDGRYGRSSTEAAPTHERAERVEIEAVAEGDLVHLSCVERTRSIERTWLVSRTYERRGGYDRGTYAGIAAFDGIIGAVIAGAALGICTRADTGASCWNAAFAAPHALGAAYGLVRAATARPSVLIDKSRSDDRLRYGADPVEERPVSCAFVASLWLGGATGPTDEDALNGVGAGSEARVLHDDAIEIPFEPGAATGLPAEAAEAWAQRGSRVGLWAQDAGGGLHPVAIDRCRALRPHALRLSESARAAFHQACSAPELHTAR